jgi:DNA-directed RNA polymerase specialized sigma24 family protein
MDTKEYLQQAFYLDQLIKSEYRDLARLRQNTYSVGSPGFEQHYNPNRPTEAPFVKALEKTWDAEAVISAKVKKLETLKQQIITVIDAVPDTRDRLVLKYRYLDRMSWEKIAACMYASERTVRRWHDEGISQIVLPENAISIKDDQL